jgi:hypothetical protein
MDLRLKRSSHRGCIIEYLQLWDLLENFELQLEIEDKHIWQFSTSGNFSTKSAYEALFTGAIHFGPWERIWQSWAPGKCMFSCGQ